MNKQSVNTFVKGLNKDVDKSVLSKNSYLNADNFRIVTSEGSSSGALENIKGNRWSNSATPFATDQLVCGSVRVRDYLVVFTTSNTSATPDGGHSMIYKLTLDKVTEEITTCTVLYDDSLNNSAGTLDFSTANVIKAVAKYETPNIQKVYWTDAYNHIRYADVAKNLTITGGAYTYNNYMAPEMFEFLPLFTSTKPEISDVINGHLQNGMVQYAYQLYRLNGASTAFSPTSDMFHIVSDSDFKNNTLHYSGDGEDVVTGKGCKVSIDNQNTGYTRLRLARIHYTTLNSIPVINIVAEIEIDSNPGIVTISDVGDNVSSLTLDEFNISSTELFKCEDISIKDNRLFAANIEKDEFIVDDWDSRAVRFRNYTDPSPSPSSSDTTTPHLFFNNNSTTTFTPGGTEKTYQVTISNFSTEMASEIPSNRTVTGITSMSTTRTLYECVGGVWYDVYLADHVFSEVGDNCSFGVYSYNAGTDELVFSVTSNNTDLWGADWDYVDIGYVYDVTVTYTYTTSGAPVTYEDAVLYDGSSLLRIEKPVDPDSSADWETARWTDDLFPVTHDAINKFNDTDNDFDESYACKYQADCVTLGAEGKNVKIDFVTELVTLDNSNSSTSFSAGLETDGSYTNFANPWKDGELSWQRDETYRLFAVWYDDRGRKSVPQWIIDLRMPSFHDDVFLDSDGTSQFPYMLANYATNTVYTRILKPRIYFKSFPTNAVACQVYRVKRERSDRSIVTQGLAVPTCALSTEYFPDKIDQVLLASNGVELIKLVSPEININRNISKQSNDYIEYVTYFSSVLSTNSTYGDLNRNTYKMVANVRVDYTDNVRSAVNEASAIEPALDTNASDFITLDSKTYCNYHPVSITGDGGKGSSGLLVSYSNTSWSAEGINYVVVNYKSKVFGSQYGGNSYEDRQLNISVPCSDLLVSEDVWHDIKYGDTFINYFDVSTLLYDLTLSNFTTSQSEVCYVPLESSINCDLRHDIHSQHLTYATVFSALRQEYSGEHTFVDTVGPATAVYYQDTDLYLYNTVYSQQPSAQYAISEMLDVSDETVFDCIVKASNVKYNGENSDSWTNFNINEEIEVDSNYGAIRAIETFNSKLFYWQEDAFGILSVNDRSLIQDNSGAQLALGSGGVLDRYDYISDTIGILSKRSIVISDTSVYWFYDKDTSIYMFDSKLSNLTKSKGMWSWFKNNYSSGHTVHGIYDRAYNEVIYTLYSNIQPSSVYVTESDILLVSNSVPATVYSYNPSTKVSTLLDIPGIVTSSPDIAHTLTKLWLLDYNNPVSFREWDITLGLFTATPNRSIANSINSAGLHAINNTKLVTYNPTTTPPEWNESDITTTTISHIKKFNAVAGRSIWGDYILTTTNKLISLEYETTSPYNGYVVQYDYLTGNVEVTINLSPYFASGVAYAYGIFEYANEIYIGGVTGSPGNLSGIIYKIDKNSPYTMTLHDTTTYVINGASQIASRLTTHFGDPDISEVEEETTPVVVDSYTLAFNEQTDQFTSFYSFLPRMYIDFKDVYLTVKDVSSYSDLYMHNSSIEPRCEFYGTVYASTIKLLYNDDYPITKVFDNIFYISNAYDEDTDVDQYSITFDEVRCYDDYQNSDWVDLVYPTNIMRRERGWTIAVPRNLVDIDYINSPDVFDAGNIDSGATKVWHERIRDKYLVLDLSFDNTSETRFVVPFIGIKYRISYR